MSELAYTWLIATNEVSDKLRKTIDSILEINHHGSFEIVLVVNGAALNAMISNVLHPRSLDFVRLYRCQLPGLTHSLNMGLNEAKGRYILRIDTGDIALPNRVDVSRGCHSKFSSPAVVTAMADWEGSVLNSSKFISLTDFLFGNPLSHPTLSICRATLINVGGYQGWGTAQDYDLWLRLIVNRVPIYYDRTPTVLYEKFSSGLSRDFNIAYRNQIGSLARILFSNKFIFVSAILFVATAKLFFRSAMNRFSKG